MRINDSKGEEPKNAAMNGQRKNLIEVEPQKPVRLLYVCACVSAAGKWAQKFFSASNSCEVVG